MVSPDKVVLIEAVVVSEDKIMSSPISVPEGNQVVSPDVSVLMVAGWLHPWMLLCPKGNVIAAPDAEVAN